jgi:5-methylcytosine-specific restriction endonuclease McrA
MGVEMVKTWCRHHGIVDQPHDCAPHAKRNQKLRAAVCAAASLCWRCGKPFTPTDPAVAHHIIPQVDGGQDTIDNLAALHRSCNARIGALRS